MGLVFAALRTGAVENAPVAQQLYQAAEVFSAQSRRKAAPAQSSAQPQCLALHGHCWAWASPDLPGHSSFRATARLVSPDCIKSESRRVGTEFISTCKSRCSPLYLNK